MPTMSGVHHVTLTVSDVDSSVEWYRRVLGFELTRRARQGELSKAMLARPDLPVTLILVGHGAAADPGPFDERHAGLDHLGFAVAGRAELTEWAAALDDAGVPRSSITAGSSGELIAFRDPDNIALEFYTR